MELSKKLCPRATSYCLNKEKNKESECTEEDNSGSSLLAYF